MNPRLNILPLLLAMLVIAPGASRSAAAGVSGSFDAANALYEQGKFADAAGAYEKLIQSGAVSAPLYFNLGNALFKSGQVGRAIAAYRQAAALTPRDPDLRANLQFARNQVQGPSLRVGRWERWLGSLSLNEWTTLAAGAIWVTFLLLAARQLNPKLGQSLRGLALCLGGAAVILCACLGLALGHHLSTKTAIVTVSEAAVRGSPLDDAASAFVAHDGAELRVVDAKGDWLQVTDGVRRPGWVRRDKVLTVPEKS